MANTTEPQKEATAKLLSRRSTELEEERRKLHAEHALRGEELDRKRRQLDDRTRELERKEGEVAAALSACSRREATCARKEREIEHRTRILDKREALLSDLVSKERCVTTPDPPEDLLFPGERVTSSRVNGAIGKVERVQRTPNGLLYHVRWTGGSARVGTHRRGELERVDGARTSSVEES